MYVIMTDERHGIYIITDGTNNTKCKVGFHSGNLSSLEKRYITAIPNMYVRFFIQTKNNELENDIKSKFESNRILNINNNMSEWYNIDYNKIIKFILENNKFEKIINEEPKIIQDIIEIQKIKNQKKIIEDKKEIKIKLVNNLEKTIKKLSDQIYKKNVIVSSYSSSDLFDEDEEDEYKSKSKLKDIKKLEQLVNNRSCFDDRCKKLKNEIINLNKKIDEIDLKIKIISYHI